MLGLAKSHPKIKGIQEELLSLSICFSITIQPFTRSYVEIHYKWMLRQPILFAHWPSDTFFQVASRTMKLLGWVAVTCCFVAGLYLLFKSFMVFVQTIYVAEVWSTIEGSSPNQLLCCCSFSYYHRQLLCRLWCGDILSAVWSLAWRTGELFEGQMYVQGENRSLFNRSRLLQWQMYKT